LRSPTNPGFDLSELFQQPPGDCSPAE
jgi:hypothetical protein